MTASTIQTKPFIPASEYPERWRRVQAMMAQEGLDVLIAYADDRQTYGNAHARWLTDFPVMFEPVCVLLQQTGDPIMLCGPESDEYARQRSRVPDVRVLREFTRTPTKIIPTPSFTACLKFWRRRSVISARFSASAWRDAA
jgi:hypothetical protein